LVGPGDGPVTLSRVPLVGPPPTKQSFFCRVTVSAEELPITSWNYKQHTGTRHMGPTALSVTVESKVGGSGQP